MRWLVPIPTGVKVTLAIEHRGIAASLVAALTSGLTRRYITLESAGLKSASEGTKA
jgi:hypothetical protein